MKDGSGTINRPQLLSLSKHASRACTLVADLTGHFDRSHVTEEGEELEWMSAADWLHMAASIRSVEIDPDPNGDTMMCSSAWEYASARAEISQLAMKETVVFNFLWGAFETVVKLIGPTDLQAKKFGLVRACYRYIAERHEGVPLVPAYLDALRDLRELLKQTESLINIEGEFALKGDMCRAGLGIYVVSRLRNKLAHGASALPEPDDWGPLAEQNVPAEEHEFVRLVATSSRIVLLTIQMLVFCLCRRSAVQISSSLFLDRPFLKLADDPKLEDVTRCLHLEDVSSHLGVDLFSGPRRRRYVIIRPDMQEHPSNAV